MAQVVDANLQPVGSLVDPFKGLVIRKNGDDWITFNTNTKGFVQSRLTFYYKLPNCGGTRYIGTDNGVAFAYLTLFNGSVGYYSRVVDRVSSPVQSMEVFEVGQTVGTCSPFGASLPVGAAISVDLTALAPTFRIQ
jgi:hypothetical protein